VIVFYGRDTRARAHKGKGTLMENITTLALCVTTCMSDDLVSSNSNWPKKDVVVKLCEKRSLICDGVESSDGSSYNT
jgi:hypothetical protein